MNGVVQCVARTQEACAAGTPMLYEALNSAVLDLVPKTATRVLDLGCGTGTLGREIKNKKQCEVLGVTFSRAEALLAERHLDEVVVADLNDYDPAALGQFDCIVCSHILEHLHDPGGLLVRLSRCMDTDSLLIVALPNALHWKQRFEFLSGRFRYTDGGPMDRSHLRFFDWESAYLLLQDTGLQVEYRSAEGYVPLPMLRRSLGCIASWLDGCGTKVLPGLFAIQFLFIARRGRQ